MAIDVREPEVRTPPPAAAPDGSRDLEIDGQRYRRRNPLGAYLLVPATLGLYAVIWQYRANDEARRYLGDRSITPGVSALAVMIGLAAPVPLVVAVVAAILGADVGLVLWALAAAALVVIPIPLIVSVYRTGERIRRMQIRAKLEPSASGAVGVLLSPAMLHIPLFQSEMNDIWGRARSLPGVGLLKGLTVTLRHLLSRSVTQQYPHEKPDLPPRTRGVIALKTENCTVCWKCSKECPDWCIYIESHKETHDPASGGRARSTKVLDRFAIDFALCMYCGICVEVCPFDALFWSPEFEYSVYDIVELTHEKEKLQDWTYTVLPPPELEVGAEPEKVEVSAEAPTSVAPIERPGAEQPDTPSPATDPEQAATPQAEAAARPAPPAPPAAPAEREEVEPDQETYERVLQEQLDAGTNPRVAEGRAKAAAVRAARQKAQGGGG
jgi:NADH-quinone oxidoreductase subunit I